MYDVMKLRPFLKPSTGIGRGHGKRKNMGKGSAKTQKEMKKTKAQLAQAQEALKAKEAELKETQEMLRTIQSAYNALEDRIEGMNTQAVKSAKKEVRQYAELTQPKFRAAYDVLHKFREFVRICDLRRSLNASPEDFNNMIRALRDNRTIQIFRADESHMTQDDIRDSFVDENHTIQGIMTWHGR